MNETPSTHLVIPIRDDYESVRFLLIEIRQQNQDGRDHPLNYRVLLVDDGSQTTSIPLQDAILKDFPEVQILKLDSRLGHQTAIYRGLQHLADFHKNSNVVVLDGDGEDLPKDALHLARELLITNHSVICAQRLSRDVGASFRIGYRVFTWAFKKLVGFDFRSGNFMAISSEYLNTVLSFSGIRNHVAAAVVRYSSNIKFQSFHRGSRIAGKSKMNFSNLTLHGYGAFSVYADVLLARVCLFLLAFSFIGFSAAISLIVLRLFNVYHLLQGWTSTVVLQLLSLILILTTNSILMLLLLLKVEKKD